MLKCTFEGACQEAERSQNALIRIQFHQHWEKRCELDWKICRELSHETVQLKEKHNNMIRSTAAESGSSHVNRQMCICADLYLWVTYSYWTVLGHVWSLGFIAIFYSVCKHQFHDATWNCTRHSRPCAIFESKPL